ncbi:unnamed protein product [Pylaiella littoralis]
MNKVLKLAFKPADYLLSWPEKSNKFLEGVYAPVQEEISAEECEVLGEVPDAVSGVFARNGPNARFAPTGGYHLFDGDGMIHGVRIKSSGKVLYTNSFVKTKLLQAQEEEGHQLGLKMGDFGTRLGFPKMMLEMLKAKLGVVPDFRGMKESTANTSLEFHAGSLMALGEGGLPYALRVMCDGVFETIGQASFDGQMKTVFTAHPKKDPSTGKLYGFAYQLDAKPYVTMYVLGTDGKIERQFPVDVPRGTMMHDFAITENFAVFLDLPMVLKTENMMKGKFPIVFDKAQDARIGILPLDATDSSSIRWFDMPQTYVAFHALNAWEEKVDVDGQTNTVVKVITCDFFELDLDQNELSKDLSPDGKPQPYTSTLNLDTGKATRASVLPQPPKEGLDFPQLRRTLVGRKNRFGYFTGFDDTGMPSALVKVDLEAATPETAEVGRIDLGDWVGGEGIFVPSKEEGADEEDDGFLVSFVSPKNCGNSELRVWNAKTMSAHPVATVKLPARVPLGFHAIFISEADLATQKQEQ